MSRRLRPSSLLPYELLAPLTRVMGLASLLKDEGGQVKEAAEGILRGTQELEVRMSKFLLHAEIQSAQPGVPMAPGRAAAVLAEATRARAVPMGREADVEIEIECFQSPMSSHHLRVVMHELVENALKFSEPGSAVTIRGRRDGAAACLLSVTDRGRGMTAEQIAAVIDAPFARRHRAPTALGLGIVRRLAEIHGGRMSFEPVDGGGTSVVLRFAAPRFEIVTGLQGSSLWLDARDVITAVDEAWLQFARANEAPELTRPSVVGRPLRAFVAGAEVVELIGHLTAAARGRGTSIAVPFRCDSPDERRFMTMTLQAEPGGAVHIAYRLDRTERRAGVALFDVHAPRSLELVLACSWCRRVRLGQDWRDVERAIADGELSRSDRLPKIAQGLCDDCTAVVRAAARRDVVAVGPSARQDAAGANRRRSG